jgi:anti-sigma factor RsiW
VKQMKDLKERDLKQLSAYLDGELNPKDASRLETRLEKEPLLRKALSELDKTRKLIGSLPEIRPPRSFALTPEMVGTSKKRSLYPLFRFATVVAVVAFAVLVGMDAFLRSGSGMARSADLVVQEVEMAAKAEIEKIEQAVAADESSMTATSESTMETPQESLGVEQPQASEPDETIVSGGEAMGVTTTEESGNRLQLAPSGTSSPPSGVLPEIPPSVEGQRETIEPEPTIPLLQPTPVPEPELESEVPPSPIEPIRAAEVGLGISTAILIVITIFLRRQR